MNLARLARFPVWLCLLACGGPTWSQTYVVRPGDTLWGISQKRLHSPLHWPEIGNANRIRTPHLLQPGTVLQFAPNEAIVLAVKGSAWRREPDGSRSSVAYGQKIKQGDVFETDTDSFITLGLLGGNRSVLPSQSAIEVLSIDALTVRLKLLAGRVESQVDRQLQKQRFEIRTRSVGLAVRGTHFRVRDENGRLFAEVLTGNVVSSAGAGNTVAGAPSALDGGQGAVLSGQGADQGARDLLPPPQLTNASEIASSRIVLLQPMAAASGYRMQLAEDDRFLHPVYEREFVEPRAEIPQQLPAGFYHLRVTAFDRDRVEGTNEDIPLYIASVVPPPRLLPDGRVEIRWRNTGAPVLFELSRDAVFSIVTARSELTTPGVTVGPFALGGTYHWHILRAGEPAVELAKGSFDVPADRAVK